MCHWESPARTLGSGCKWVRESLLSGSHFSNNLERDEWVSHGVSGRENILGGGTSWSLFWFIPIEQIFPFFKCQWQFVYTPQTSHISLTRMCSVFISPTVPSLTGSTEHSCWMNNELFTIELWPEKNKPCISNLFNLLTIKLTLSTWMVCLKVSWPMYVLWDQNYLMRSFQVIQMPNYICWKWLVNWNQSVLFGQGLNLTLPLLEIWHWQVI